MEVVLVIVALWVVTAVGVLLLCGAAARGDAEMAGRLPSRDRGDRPDPPRLVP